MRRLIAALLTAALLFSAVSVLAEEGEEELIVEEVLLEDEAPEAEAPAAEESAETEPEKTDPAGDYLLGVEPEPSDITPAYRSEEHPGHGEGCFWCTPMNLDDEEAIWAMLTSPITVVQAKDKAKSLDDQMRQTVLYAEPDEKSEKIGMVTGQSQGVHVLETRDDGWSKVETYSTSFHDSKVKNWNGFVTGWIQTKKLITDTKVNQHYGIIIDKLTQRLYLFVDGHLETSLAVSTGLYNKKQPYNESRSGEYLLIYYRKGDLPDGDMHCLYPIRFNGGDYLHEVPHKVLADGTKKYTTFESKLGSRASHGCIRVQRQKNTKGYNMNVLFNMLKKSVEAGEGYPKMVIWEDYEGRRVKIPADDTPLYYNPNGGSMYHSIAECPGVKEKFRPLTAFTYGELEEKPFSKLKKCDYCQPVSRRETLEKINQEHENASPGEVMSYHKK